MKKYAKPIAAFVMLAVVLIGCSKDPLRDMTEDESRIYITNRDSTVSFTSFKTFSISDSVAVISNNQLAGRERTQFDQRIVEAVTNEMTSKGYTLVQRDADPDLGINVSRLYNSSTGIISYPNYWGGYYDYYDPFYWGYPGYGYAFPNYGVYQITEGALSIDVLNFKDAEQSKTIKGIWNGLVRGSGVFVSANAPNHVRALFDQSPYLRAN
ncbi:MAG: DUF4136 domain-containing protein [Chitinophagaceae bacterium]|nr:MAG: DUF4136 domain-containing protein [Chitinophagaceae bacterium]